MPLINSTQGVSHNSGVQENHSVEKSFEERLSEWANEAEGKEKRGKAKKNILSAINNNKEKLDLSNLKLNSLPDFLQDMLPESVEEIDLSSNKLLELPDLSNTNIAKLNCSSNQLVWLPNLPKDLEHLDCSNNDLVDDLTDLPESLEYLNCANNMLDKLTSLPENLEYFYCNENDLEEITSLPNSLKHLDCSQNRLELLPELPKDLKNLNCCKNILRSMPELPDSIKVLNCSVNWFEMEEFPELPEKLRTFDCSKSGIKQLPSSLPPSLETLDCSHNRIMNFEFLEHMSNKTHIDSDGNPGSKGYDRSESLQLEKKSVENKIERQYTDTLLTSNSDNGTKDSLEARFEKFAERSMADDLPVESPEEINAFNKGKTQEEVESSLERDLPVVPISSKPKNKDSLTSDQKDDTVIDPQNLEARLERLKEGRNNDYDYEYIEKLKSFKEGKTEEELAQIFKEISFPDVPDSEPTPLTTDELLARVSQRVSDYKYMPIDINLIDELMKYISSATGVSSEKIHI